MAGARWTCRAYCQGCGVRVYLVERLPENSKADVERLLGWIRANTRAEHRRAHPGCPRFRIRWTWEPWAPERERAAP